MRRSGTGRAARWWRSATTAASSTACIRMRARRCSRWLAYQARLAEIAAEIPLYSNAYFDFHISALQDYEPARSGNWSIAVTEAVLSDFVPEEEKEEEEEFELEGEEDGTGDLEGEDLE